MADCRLECRRHVYGIGQLIASRSDGAISFHVTSLRPVEHRPRPPSGAG
jgi:hypothetical protein